MRKHYYVDVPKLGNVAVSRHAQGKMDEDGITQDEFEKVLLQPIREDVPDSIGILSRERDGIRVIIVEKPQPFKGAKLVKTVYRLKEIERVKGK
jgi:uncharacterized protein DUF4258